MSRIDYYDNKAQYGPDIASYPVKIKIANSTQDEMRIENVGSGLTYPQTLYFGLYDYDDQIVALENSYQILISAVDAQVSSIDGFNAVLLDQGIARFDNMAFTASPGSSNISYKATSKAIDTNKIQNVFEQSISENNINVNFRFCKPGEIMSNNKCLECSAGTYSLGWNSTECKSCVDNAVCNGKEQIQVDPKHWRRTTNSTKIVK